jgi:phosphotransferase system enzyme I (PtsI)
VVEDFNLKVPSVQRYSTKTSEQKIYKGIPSSSGIMIGRAVVIQPESIIIPEHTLQAEQIDDEIKRFNSALDAYKNDLNRVIANVKNDEANLSAIIESNVLMLEDPSLTMPIENNIKSGYTAESSIVSAIDKLKSFFKTTKDAILQERIFELDNIKKGLLATLRNQCFYYAVAKDAIVIAKSLTPTDVINFRDAGVKAFVTEIGGIASHSSILARSFELPEVIGVLNSTDNIKDGDYVIVDGYTGQVIVNPTSRILESFQRKKSAEEEHKRELGEIINLNTETLDGKRCHLYANVDLPEEARAAFLWGAEGIGLFRSESLIVSLGYFPSEREQYDFYKQLSDTAYPKELTIRAFDVGSDKWAEGLPTREDNPALGFRGIRFLLTRKDLFKIQIRAILRASINKNIRFMLPMISSVQELQTAHSIIDDVKNELDLADIAYDTQMPIGIMIETPAAVLLAEDLAKHADFFSIGTNDLTQYTVAADRTNDLVSNVFDTFNPAVIRLIKMAIDAAKSNNIPIGICGEFAGHAASTAILIGLGIDELSVAPPILLETKNRIRSINYVEANEIANQTLACSTSSEISNILDKIITE